MNDARHDPDEQWIDVPDGEKPWGRTVRTWVDDSGKRHVQTNVPRPVEQPTVQEHYMALFLDGEGRMHVRRPDGAIEPLQFTPTDGSKAIQWASEQPAEPDVTLTVAAPEEVWVPMPHTVRPDKLSTSGLAHDVTTWTERTDRRLAALEDAVNRIADRLQYLLLRLEGDGK